MPQHAQLITAPAVTEPFGLATAVGGGGIVDTSSGDPLDPQGNWIRGYAMVGEVCGVQDLYIVNPACDVDDDPPTDPEGDFEGFSGLEANVPGVPIVVGAGVTCSTFGSPNNVEAWHEKADRRLELCQWSELAHELWTGEKTKLDETGNRYLMSPDATLLESGAPLSVIDAIARMDEGFRQCTCGGPRVVHAPMYLLTWMAAKSVAVQKGNRWYTPAGNHIVFDDGYPGTGPDEIVSMTVTPRAEPDAGQGWIYGTMPVAVKWGPIEHPEPLLVDGFDSQRNNFLFRAQRYATATWMCCHLAALVDTTIGDDDDVLTGP